MPACTRRAIAMRTDFVAADDIEATARRTGVVQRTAKITGKLVLALVTFGTWSAGKTTFAQLAAKGTQLRQPVEVSPEAIHQRMNKKAMAFLQDMLRQVLANLQSLTPVCDDGLCSALTNVYLADSTGVALPDDLQKTFPGAGGRAATAGAKLQAVWDYTSSLVDPFALTPGNIPDQRYVDTVVTWAQHGRRLIFDGGYCKVTAFARLARAGAYCCCRRNHQTRMYATVAGRLEPVPLAAFLLTGAPDLLRFETAIFRGATERVASRRMAVRMPEAVVKARRSIARKHAKKKGDTPSPAPLTRRSWNLLIPHVPPTRWKTAPVTTVSPMRWQIERMLKSWKSALHGAALTTTKADAS